VPDLPEIRHSRYALVDLTDIERILNMMYVLDLLHAFNRKTGLFAEKKEM
jgi:hypothetical protein